MNVYLYYLIYKIAAYPTLKIDKFFYSYVYRIYRNQFKLV